jgi:hypothetical protein
MTSGLVAFWWSRRVIGNGHIGHITTLRVFQRCFDLSGPRCGWSSRCATRHCVGYELDPAYAEAARRRVEAAV